MDANRIAKIVAEMRDPSFDDDNRLAWANDIESAARGGGEAVASDGIEASCTWQTAPEKIWLQVDPDGNDYSEPFPDQATWCSDSIGGVQVKYIRADLAAPPAPAIPDGNKPGDGWKENAKYLLAHCPYTIRMRDSEHPDDLLTSLVVTFSKMQAMLSAAPSPEVPR